MPGNDSACVSVIFDNVSVQCRGQTILEHVTAEAPAGTATVIIGPNGAGKTTLLRCLLGEIDFSGQILFRSASGHLCGKPVIGYVPQYLQGGSHMPLLVRDFMAIGRARRPLWLGCGRNTREEARRYLSLSGAGHLEERRLGDLSGGELRRVLLASALSRRPDLLVLDEAEAGVDYRGERMFWQLLDDTRKELGFTLLMVSHNLPLAAHYANHVICVKKRVLAQGTPRETMTGENLLALFGVPIHLYPQQCDDPGPACPECGALGNLPYLDDAANDNSF